MIKSNKYGINLVLDPNIPFVELLKDVIEKFKASEKFFKNAELAISFEGRKLSEEEENRIIEAITENTTIQIAARMCISFQRSKNDDIPLRDYLRTGIHIPDNGYAGFTFRPQSPRSQWRGMEIFILSRSQKIF